MSKAIRVAPGIYRLPSGHYQARWRGPNGEYGKETFAKLADAKAHRAKVAVSKLDGSYVDRTVGRRLFADVAQDWLASNPGKRPTTYVRDADVIRLHLDPVVGKVQLANLHPSHCRAVVSTMEAKGLAPRTIKTNVGVLRAILNWAVESDLLVRSPYRAIKLPAIPPARGRRGDAGDVLRLVEEVPTEYRVAVFLGALGLRLAEVTGLRVGSIDFLRRTVTVQDTLNEVRGRWEPGDGKTKASHRTIALPAIVVDELAAHLARTGRTDPGDLVLTAPDGGPMRPTNFRTRVLNPALVRAGLEGLTFHRLRHSAGHIMREAGAGLEAIQKRLGHASMRTTADVYGSLPAPVDRAIAADLDRLFRAPAETSCAPFVPHAPDSGSDSQATTL